MTATVVDGEEAPLLARLGEVVAEDLATLARLHDREPDRETLGALREVAFPDGLGLRLRGERGQDALRVMRAAIEDLPDPLDDATLDQLAVDFAEIYLTFGVRASPYESVWLDDDGLQRQEPMFQVRSHYRRYGLETESWAQRADDHLVLQLSFLGHLFGHGDDERVLRDAATFMDQHLLRWIDRFATKVAGRCATPYFAGLALLTAAYVDEVRDLLAAILGEPRPQPEEIAARLRPQHRPPCAPAPYAPGTGPGW